MARKNEEVRSKNEDVTAEEVAVIDVVYDLASLFEMKFRDPLNGQIVMVRRAFKPRGKLEFYCPEKN